jgi:hypothetical protein
LQASGESAARIFEYVPAAQCVQSAELIAPSASEYEPIGHDVQSVAPAVAYLPATHVAHALGVLAPVVAENEPAGQLMHVMMLVAASAVENLPATHDVQDVAPWADHVPA